MFSEDYKRGVCLDDLDVGLDWNTLIKLEFSDASGDFKIATLKTTESLDASSNSNKWLQMHPATLEKWLIIATIH